MVTAVDQLSLEVERGHVFTLLGPSGCGKTTTLRMVAGLERPDGGRITFGDRTLSDATTQTWSPPHKRNLGMVFQSYAIWPHMTVFDNVAYPLRLRGASKREIQRRVGDVLALVGMEPLAQRPATDLSGGQQQRVALSRALVYEPGLLLLDEPFSNLDAQLRVQMRVEVRMLQQRLGITVLFVTHDQLEALSMSDQIAVLNQGRLEQVGAPGELYDRPASTFVRDFLGRTIRPWPNVWVRPEDVQVAHRNGGVLPSDNAIEGVIDTLLFVGDRYEAHITASSGEAMLLPLARSGAWSPGDAVVVSWSAERAQRWPD